MSDNPTYQKMCEIRRLAHDARQLLHGISKIASELQDDMKQQEGAALKQHEAEDSHLMDQYDTIHGDMGDAALNFYDDSPDIYSGTYSEE